MYNFQIPPEFKIGFESISKLNSKELTEIISILNSVNVGIGRIEFIEQLKSKIKISHIEKIAETIYSLGSILVSEKYSKDSSREIAAAFLEDKKNAKTYETELKKLEKIISQLFNASENLKLTFKSNNLLEDNSNLFVESRILSDVRLIFNDDLGNGDRNAVIVHRLKIEYVDDHNLKKIYFTLDNNDLQKLKVQIDRAIDKEKIIKNSYKNNIKFIDIGE